MTDGNKSASYTTIEAVETLLELTRNGQVPTTYQEIHTALKGNPNDRRRRHLDFTLADIQRLCAANDLPCLPALASREIGAPPGTGFFKAYADEYGINTSSDSGKARIVALERAAVTLASPSCWAILRQAAEESNKTPSGNADGR